MNFEEYLISKKIDAKAFAEAEPRLFNEWKYEFEQMHPNSFTMQKLNLINSIRRKYQLNADEKVTTAPNVTQKSVMRPKPKFN